MSICAFPQVRIYEDFDKMSAKEVYFNEAGNKITVKLLHFPDVPPEDMDKIKFDDDDDVVDAATSAGVARMGAGDAQLGDGSTVLSCDSIKTVINISGYDESEEEYYGVPLDDDEESLQEADVEDAEFLKRTSYSDSQIASHATRKALRKRSLSNLFHSRKCSNAFAQARGLQRQLAVTTPTIMIPTAAADAVIGNNLRRQLQLQGRRSPSPHGNGSLCPGYAQYSKSFLEVPLPRDYGYASSDDLSSEWDSDVSTTSTSRQQVQVKKPSGWRKIRNIVQWTPFFQTYKKQRYPWVQLAGHQGNFKAGPEQGTVLKKLCAKEEDCFQVLMKDVLRPYVPEYKGQVTSEDGELYLQLQDLLSDFYQPCVMDCKIGVRTYLEEELSKAKEKPKLRKDMYEKMIQIDPNAPNDEEHKAKGVTKPRYMVWRETISSTSSLGFRIEGIKKSDGTSSKDFKTTKSREQIKQAFREFINGFQHALPRYMQRLRAIRATLECSDFFRQHEVIGSSLLFVHDRKLASVWLIDFAKTIVLPLNHEIDHNTSWKVGNHEDGYLIGINNLLEIFSELDAELVAASEASLSASSSSSSTSSSPKRGVSESNNEEQGAVGGCRREGGGSGTMTARNLSESNKEDSSATAAASSFPVQERSRVAELPAAVEYCHAKQQPAVEMKK